MSSTAALFCGLASEPFQLVLLRFIVGAGMAFFFSSSITLIADYGRAKSTGLSIGGLNAAHSAGGIIGIFGWILVASATGWRQSILLSGAIGILSGLFMVVALPRDLHLSDNKRGSESMLVGEKNIAGSDDKSRHPPAAPGLLRNTLQILSDAGLARIGIFLIGIQGAWALVLTYLVVYLQSLSVPAQTAGIIASLPLISAIISAPLLGRLYDNTRKAARIMVICGIGISLTLVFAASGSIPIITAAVILTGVFSGGGFTVAYAKARSLQITTFGRAGDGILSRDSQDFRYGALKVAWINGISLVGVVWMPLLFSYIAKQFGYQWAWPLSAAMVIPFVAILLTARRN